MDTLSLHEKTSAFPNHLYRQPHSPVPATLSAQVAHHCQDCGRPLSFEEVGFPLESGHGRCGPCRKRQEAIAEARARFEELASNEHRTADVDRAEHFSEEPHGDCADGAESPA
jgi:hypothetical protein